MKRGDRILVKDDEKKSWFKRIFIANVGGKYPYICVSVNGEEAFPNGEYNTVEWKYAKEIKEPKWRPFEDGEMPERYFDYAYRSNDSGIITRSISYNPIGYIQLALRNYWTPNSVLFESYTVKINGEWFPVGVKE